MTLDKEYFDCVNKADKELLQTGIRLRSEIQRTQCSKPTTTASASTSTVGSSSQVVSDASTTNSVSDPSLLWFCDTNEKDGTLAKFEKISLDLFLRNLDYDERDDDEAVATASTRNKKSSLTLVDLEKRRQIDLQKEILQQQQEEEQQQRTRGGNIAAKIKKQQPPMKIGQAASSQNVLDDEEMMLRRLQ